jgi:hypothetical protein
MHQSPSKGGCLLLLSLVFLRQRQWTCRPLLGRNVPHIFTSVIATRIALTSTSTSIAHNSTKRELSLNHIRHWLIKDIPTDVCLLLHRKIK